MTSARPSSACSPSTTSTFTSAYRARARREDVLLAGRVRLGHARARDARYAAGRVRELRTDTLRRLARDSDVVFLANIQPDVQRHVRAQLSEHALRGARHDEPVDRNGARLAAKAINEVDCLIVNDAELRQLARKPSLVRGSAREVLAGSLTSGQGRRREARRVRRRPDHARRLLPSIPASPARDCGRPDRSRGLLRRRVRRLHRGAYAGSRSNATNWLLRRAMAYSGTAIASFNVEEFGTERVARLADGRDRRARRRSAPDDRLRLSRAAE